MDESVYVLGGGGHARVVLDALRVSGVVVTGLLDPALKIGDDVLGTTVRGGDVVLEDLSTSAAILANGVGALPLRRLRATLFERWRARGFRFVSVRHPSAVVSDYAALAEGSQVMAGVVIQCGATVAENAVVNTGARVDHDCWIGPHAFVGTGAVLCGNVRVCEHAFVGAGAIVLPGLEVGAGAIVAAGAIVTRRVAVGETVVGNPARSSASPAGEREQISR